MPVYNECVYIGPSQLYGFSRCRLAFNGLGGQEFIFNQAMDFRAK